MVASFFSKRHVLICRAAAVDRARIGRDALVQHELMGYAWRYVACMVSNEEHGGRGAVRYCFDQLS